jgi:hypothetical protein
MCQQQAENRLAYKFTVGHYEDTTITHSNTRTLDTSLDCLITNRVR